ncbi:MAG: hypothetical protein P8Y26_10655 [Gemmatimonadales bacterium]
MRPIGSATISFGLVSVPTSLYSVAESAANISFNWIHKDCGSRVKQRQLAKYAARGKQYLVLVRPMEEGLLLEQLHYADELRPFSEVPLGEADVKDEELKLAVQLIEQAASEAYKPEKYEDEVRNRIMALINEKIETGEEITAAPTVETETKVIDLMAALKASLGEDEEAADSTSRKAAKRAGSKKKASKKAASGG